MAAIDDVEYFYYIKYMAPKKRPVGRPTKPAGKRRTSDLRIPVNSEEKRSVQEAAKKAGGRGEMADWARGVLLAAAEQVLNQPE
jgi:hypothetical protein